jgi:hypothetical protein
MVGRAGGVESSHGVAGTSAGSAYTSPPRRFASVSRTGTPGWSARMLKCTCPEAPAWSRVMRIWSTISVGAHESAGRAACAPTRLV